MSRIIIIAACLAVVAGCVTVHEDPEITKDREETPTFLRQEIEGRVAALPFQSEQELYRNIMRLVYIGEPAVPYLLDGLKSDNARSRGSCAYALGVLRDRRTIQPLRNALDDPIPEVAYEIATALCALGEKSGYAKLVTGLSDPEIRNRYKCHEALKLLTELDFGFEHDEEPTKRQVAVLRWEGWLERMEDSPL